MKFNKIKIGEVLSESQHYVVVNISTNILKLKPDSGDEIEVDKEYAETFLTSGEQYEKDIVINKTQAAELFVANPYVAMTVNFFKKARTVDVENEIILAYETSTPNEFVLAAKRAIKKGLNGEERTMCGYHVGHLDDFGRMSFIDMKLDRDLRKPSDSRMRLVDPRTINYLIIRDIKYIVK